MWIICPLCGAIIAEHERHETWHANHGEHYPDPTPAPEEAP